MAVLSRQVTAAWDLTILRVELQPRDPDSTPPRPARCARAASRSSRCKPRTPMPRMRWTPTRRAAAGAVSPGFCPPPSEAGTRRTATTIDPVASSPSATQEQNTVSFSARRLLPGTRPGPASRLVVKGTFRLRPGGGVRPCSKASAHRARSPATCPRAATIRGAAPSWLRATSAPTTSPGPTFWCAPAATPRANSP